jgi:hypothetical protein
VAVATAPDATGTGTARVWVELWSPGADARLAGVAKVHNGLLFVDRQGIRVGNEEVCDIHTPEIVAWIYWLEVFVQPVANPAKVVFVLDLRASREGPRAVVARLRTRP